MRIEVREKGSLEFYREVIRATAQYQKLIKNPEAKLSDSFKLLKAYIAVCAVFMVVLLAMGIAIGFDALTVIAIVIMVACTIISAVQFNRLNAAVKALVDDSHVSIFTLDEEGVELNKEGAQVIRVSWDHVAFIRAFDESVCFFADGPRGLVLAVTKKYEQQVFGHIRENGIDVRVIGR